MEDINGKHYPLWGQFVDDKAKWIGGDMEDSGDSMDKSLGFGGAATKIKDVILKPNGETSAYFTVVGEDFSCGFDVGYGGISGNGDPGWITFSGYGGHQWKIRQPGPLSP